MPYDLLKSFPDLLTVRLHLSLSGEKWKIFEAMMQHDHPEVDLLIVQQVP
jgi:hypothetical protein